MKQYLDKHPLCLPVAAGQDVGSALSKVSVSMITEVVGRREGTCCWKDMRTVWTTLATRVASVVADMLPSSFDEVLQVRDKLRNSGSLKYLPPTDFLHKCGATAFWCALRLRVCSFLITTIGGSNCVVEDVDGGISSSTTTYAPPVILAHMKNIMYSIDMTKDNIMMSDDPAVVPAVALAMSDLMGYVNKDFYDVFKAFAESEYDHYMTSIVHDGLAFKAWSDELISKCQVGKLGDIRKLIAGKLQAKITVPPEMEFMPTKRSEFVNQVIAIARQDH